MLSGRRLDLLEPSPLDVEIDDIAHGLARVARWNGQTKGDHGFSVAQHSVLVTVSSVGAGALGVTALLLLYPELPVVKIAGSDIAHAVPLTLIAGMGHVAAGGVDMTVLVSLLCGSLPGIMLASLFAPRLPDRALRIVLSVTLTLVAIRLLSA